MQMAESNFSFLISKQKFSFSIFKGKRIAFYQLKYLHFEPKTKNTTNFVEQKSEIIDLYKEFDYFDNF
jgi:hypothetical protein